MFSRICLLLCSGLDVQSPLASLCGISSYVYNVPLTNHNGLDTYPVLSTLRTVLFLLSGSSIPLAQCTCQSGSACCPSTQNVSLPFSCCYDITATVSENESNCMPIIYFHLILPSTLFYNQLSSLQLPKAQGMPRYYSLYAHSPIFQECSALSHTGIT